MRIVGGMALGLSSSFGGEAPFVFSGIPVDNGDFRMLVNYFGYSDSMLDQRAHFLGREYLSGEWAGAVYYDGGTLGSTSRWLPNRFVFPDYFTATPHFTSVYPSPNEYMIFPDNIYGSRVFGSKITNGDVEISLKYETVDFGASPAGRLSLGWTPQSDGSAGSFLPSTQFGFKQSYEFKKNHREDIVWDDRERERFEEALEEVMESSGWVLYACG